MNLLKLGALGLIAGVLGAASVAQAAPVVVSFRDGVGGYAGTKDTYVHGNSAGGASTRGTNFGTNTKIASDGDDDLTSLIGGNTQTNAATITGLLRFDNLFACAAGPSRCSGPIPDVGPGNIIILSAILTVRTGTASGDNAASTFDYHRMIATWGESDTFNSLTTTAVGVQYDNVEAVSTSTATVTNPNTTGALVNVDVTTDLQFWADNLGTSLRGWAVKPCSNEGAAPVTGCTDGWYVDSSETATVANRPLLTVTYELVPEPTTALLLGAGLIGLARAGARRSA